MYLIRCIEIAKGTHYATTFAKYGSVDFLVFGKLSLLNWWYGFQHKVSCNLLLWKFKLRNKVLLLLNSSQVATRIQFSWCKIIVWFFSFLLVSVYWSTMFSWNQYYYIQLYSVGLGTWVGFGRVVNPTGQAYYYIQLYKVGWVINPTGQVFFSFHMQHVRAVCASYMILYRFIFVLAPNHT